MYLKNESEMRLYPNIQKQKICDKETRIKGNSQVLSENIKY